MKGKSVAMRDALLGRILDAMSEDHEIFFLCADFGSPVLDRLRNQFPDRFVNVGIAEQNLINVSAGLAIEGFKVFAYAIAPFITMRCYEQIRVNLALLSEVRPLNVNLIGVGAGYSYVVSGPTHQCYEDLTIMRALPNMQVLSPADHIAAAALFDRCVHEGGPKYLRLDAQVLPAVYEIGPALEPGFSVLRKGKSVCMVATGFMVHTAMAAEEILRREGVSAGVIDMFDLTTFSPGALISELGSYAHVVTLEEAFVGRGGLDSVIMGLAANHDMDVRVHGMGVPLRYCFELGTRRHLHDMVGIGVDAVCERVRRVATLG